MTVMWIAFLLFLLVYFAGGFFVRNATYPAPPIRVSLEPPATLEVVNLKLPGGETVVGWLASDPPLVKRPIVVYFHGNGENLQTVWASGLFHQWRELAVACLVIDYPGYGRSTGRPSEVGIREAARMALMWTRQQYPENPMIISGWSLGAAVAVQAAATNPEHADALILMSGWSTLRDAGHNHFPLWLVQLLVREQYNSLEAASYVNCPALVLHGEQDNLIPLSQGQQVASRLGGTARWIPLAGAGHNDLLGQSRVWEEIGKFLHELFELQPSPEMHNP